MPSQVEVLCDAGELYGVLGDYSRLSRKPLPAKPAPKRAGRQRSPEVADDVTDEQLDVLVDLLLVHLLAGARATGTPRPTRGRKLSAGPSHRPAYRR